MCYSVTYIFVYAMTCFYDWRIKGETVFVGGNGDILLPEQLPVLGPGLPPGHAAHRRGASAYVCVHVANDEITSSRGRSGYHDPV